MACKIYFPVKLCTTKLAQSTSQYYFVLQSLHKVCPSTTLYPTACTKDVPVLLCTRKLAQSTSQCRFVLQSLHKALPSTTLYSLHKGRPSTTLYYKACAKHVPVLCCTTQLAQSTSQYYFVLQSLHKVRPSTTLYGTASKIYVPVLLCTSKPAQSTSKFYFVLQRFHKILSTCQHITVAASMQPFHYDLRCPAAKDNSITQAAVAPSNLDAAITMRFANKDPKTAFNCDAKEHAKHIEAAIAVRTTPRLGRSQPAPVAHTRSLP